jgi:taurine dioxygenase
LPLSEGETGFLDQIALYDRLPSRLKHQIKDLFVIYRADFHVENARFARLPTSLKRVRYGESTVKAQTQTRDAPRVLHPMVFTQNETGRKVLNVSPWFAVGIDGQETEAGDLLLQEIIDHCLNDGRAYFHSWRPDDMVLFDNWRMLHSVRSIPGDSSRWMQRTTIEGDYALGRVETGGTTIRDAMRISV